jgi:GNAT superfamily N-acetyltransferase
MLTVKVDLRPFRPGDEAAFRALNEAWISKHFGMEDGDRAVLEDPVGQILRPGGHIFFALAEGRPVGCCALRPIGRGGFEVAKMTVEERHRGQRNARQLLDHVIAHARALGARRLYLETNHTLVNAIHLYESVGFRHLPPEQVEPSPYARADVFMEMALQV